MSSPLPLFSPVQKSAIRNAQSLGSTRASRVVVGAPADHILASYPLLME
jgi:hypothetical protein